MTLERALLHAKVRIPGRRFIAKGFADGGEIPIFDTENPLDPIRLEIVDPRILQLDPDGGIHLKVQISEQIGKQARGNGWSGQLQSDGREPSQLPIKGGQARPGEKTTPTGTPNINQKGEPLKSESDLAWRIESIGLEVIGRTRADR
jgi:hypothetical protein